MRGLDVRLAHPARQIVRIVQIRQIFRRKRLLGDGTVAHAAIAHDFAVGAHGSDAVTRRRTAASRRGADLFAERRVDEIGNAFDWLPRGRVTWVFGDGILSREQGQEIVLFVVRRRSRGNGRGKGEEEEEDRDEGREEVEGSDEMVGGRA